MALSDALSGITCPVVTPFEATADGTTEIDDAALTHLLEHLLEGGIDGIFPCGTTGEFASLTPAERKRVHERTVETVDGAVPVLAGAAATSVDEAVDYATHAAEIGADAAVVTEPYFHGANDPEGNRRFFEAVADRSPLPILLYNIPPCTGGSISVETIRELADHENVLGIKDSSGDLEYFCSVMRQTSEAFLALQGYDALLVPALRMGADGGLNALSNVAPAQYSELFETAADARGAEIQDAIVPLFDACADHGFAPATKTALEYDGVIPTDTVRSPLVEVPGGGRDAIATAVDGLLESET